MNDKKGKKNWIFADGDLPPSGVAEPYGHESLMITNANGKKASIKIDILFENKDPVAGIDVEVPGMRVICIRLDKPFGKQQFSIPKGQYALALHSDVPVVACFGRLDVRQPNMSYYSVQGYAY